VLPYESGDENPLAAMLVHGLKAAGLEEDEATGVVSWEDNASKVRRRGVERNRSLGLAVAADS